jgi:phosphate ABC transporter phosphate-binding protein
MTVVARRAARVCLAALMVAICALIPALPAEAQPDYALIEGTGSTWSQNAIDQWISDVQQYGIQVVYSGGGSTKGRSDFANQTNDFAVSEIPFQGTDENGQSDTSRGRQYAYLPIVAGGTSFTYHIEIGGKLLRDLRLSGETVSKIFTNQITNWNDPAITADNNGRRLPSLPIIPVVRSDGSGTTAQFTTFMDKRYPNIWRPFYGRSGLTSYFPRKGAAVAQNGSDGVMNYVAAASGNGTIGYVEYSYSLNKNYPVAKILNQAGYYVAPTDFNVAVALTQARINNDPSSPNYLTQILDQVYVYNDKRTYPLSSYSYMILPIGKNDARMSSGKRQSLADFAFYFLCEGQSAAGPLGYSPLPINLVQAGFAQTAKLKQADPSVNLNQRDVTKCNNPTFIAGQPNRNRLAEIAPMPPECDRKGKGPCAGGGTGNGNGTNNNGGNNNGSNNGDNNGSNNRSNGTNGPNGTNGDGTNGPGSTTGPNGTNSDGSTNGPTAIDPETGLPIGTNSDGTTNADAAAVASDLAAYRGNGMSGGLAALAAVEILLVLLVPALVARKMSNRKDVSK